jgi:methylated-DNA-protein-cysteine methyltransferase-like protein
LACRFPFSGRLAYDSGVSSESFAEEVYALVRQIPPGRVTTYGTISQLLGRYRSARLVGWAMRHSPAGLPAHRVVNASGTLSGGWAFGHPSVQRALLEDEGVTFIAEARCRLSAHYWPTSDEADQLDLPADP